MVAEVVVDVLNNEVDKVFDYSIPQDMTVQPGMRVAVNFANRDIEGFVIRVKDKSEFDRLKPISRVLDEDVLIQKDLFSLCDFMRDKYHLRYADVLRLFVPSILRSGKVSPQIVSYADIDKSSTYTPSNRAQKQLEAVKYLDEYGLTSLVYLKKRFGASAINALVDKGAIKLTKIRRMRKPFGEEGEKKKMSLLPAQQNAVDRVEREDGVFLLHGVTGSGKTEVYMHLIENVLKRGKRAIMLVPEISLTPQILRLFRSRFGDGVAILHSGLTEGERFDEWQRILFKDAGVVVGARSAIFAPVQDIGLIIIDEEHDGSYVSESNPRYDTYSVAKERAKLCGAKLVVGSATPSIETYTRAKRGEIKLIEMGERVNKRPLPDMSIVDMSRELREGNRGVFSRQLVSELTECVESGKQAILFINRRGYSSFLMCRECGYVPKCEDCDVTLTYHAQEGVMKCHYCTRRYKVLDECPNCGSKTIRQGRPGTEQVVAELNKLFPNTKILRMDNDTVTGKDSHHKILSAFSKGEAQILVGTQMIAKGHDFPDVTLVGILDADLSLYLSEYMSAEKTYQLITQVAGRAGRADSVGRVVLQTYTPRHYVYRYAKDYDYLGFYGKEGNLREVSKYPPYSKIVRVMFTSVEEDKARECAKSTYVALKEYREKHESAFIYLGAMKSPVTKIQKKFRYQIVMRLTIDEAEKTIRDVYKIMDEKREAKVTIFAELNPSNMH